jgi:hypothetical protein
MHEHEHSSGMLETTALCLAVLVMFLSFGKGALQPEDQRRHVPATVPEKPASDIEAAGQEILLHD